MNQKTVSMLVAAIVITAEVAVAALSIASPALAVEKDTKTNPNREEVRSDRESSECVGFLCSGRENPSSNERDT